jgi:hypothetical protein
MDEDLDDLTEKAKVLSEATGRDVEDVLEDLLDDGKLNRSNQDGAKDLVSQLKEAAELITTVQGISKEISSNTVLNGGDNKTELKVDTTLEGDIVDRAIESVQRKADNLKKLLASLIPFFLLLTGGSLEAFGVIDIMGDESDADYDDEYWVEVWGCTAPDAENFMPDATVDDGTCYWDDNNGGGGGPPPVNCQWSWNDYSFLDNEDHLVVRANFGDDSCPHEMEGRFTVELHKDGYYQTEHSWDNIKFKHNYEINFIFSDLEEGVYRNHFSFETYDGSNWNWDSPETHEVMAEVECSAFLQNQNAFLDEEDAEQDAVKMTVDIAIPSEVGDACDSHQFELTWRLYVDNQVQYEEHSWEDGWISDNDRADFASFTIQDVAVGTYDPRIILKLDGDTVIDEKWLSDSITVAEQTIFGCTDSEATNYDDSANEDDGSCEYPEPEEPCDVEIHNHYRGHVADDAEQDAILVAFRVVPSNCEGEEIEIDIQLFQNGYDANYSHWQTVSGDEEYIDVSHTFDGVAVGNSWTPTIIASLDSDILEQVWFWGIDVVEQEPETCEINLFWIEIATNSTHASVGYDLDCGYDSNNLEGYNVSVQFLVYEVNGSNSGNGTGPIQYTTDLHYIQGWVEDNNYLTLTNFTESNATHYDFYFYAIWVDADGEQQFIEQTWLNRELQP